MNAERRSNGFERARDEHLLSFSRLSAEEKLRWLAQAKEFVRKYLGAAKRTEEKPR